MMLVAQYSTPNLFTLGELRALVAQQQSVPDEAVVKLVGMERVRDQHEGDDILIIEWDEA